MKGMLRSQRLAGFVLVFACAYATRLLAETAEMKPILRHVAPPRAAIDLGGEWEKSILQCVKVVYTNAQGKTAHRFEEPALAPDAKWTPCEIPCGTLNGQEGDEDKNQYWRKTFVLPKSFEKGMMATVFFEKIGESYVLYVNGKKVCTHPATFAIPQRIDVSDYVQPGTNVLMAMTRKDGVRRPWSETPVWEESAQTGITRPVHVEYSGKAFIKDVAYDCQVTGGKWLHLRVLVRNNGEKPANCSLCCTTVGGIRIQVPAVDLAAKSEKWIAFSNKADRVEMWSPANPKLHVANLTLAADGKRSDVYNLRFGFREVKAVGHQFYLNGRPFMNKRSTWNGDNSGTHFRTKAWFFNEFKRFRERGIYSFRVFGGDLARLSEAADEYGMFTTPVAMAGCGAAWRDEEKFWPLYENQLLEWVRMFRNHPSILYWNVSNEFGSIYGGNEGGPKEKPTTDHQVKAAKRMAAEDPTRLWEACGEVELGYPIKSNEGPAPIRSYHYPIGCSDDGNELPGIAYWYANGKVPWQGIATKSKPASISEDLYHGTFDQHLGLSKWCGDDLFDYWKYEKAAHSLTRKFYEGFCFSGIGSWEPWAIGTQEAESKSFNELGTPFPDFLVSVLEFPQNLWAGETAERTVNAYNEGFATTLCRLWREDFVEKDGVYVSVVPATDVAGVISLEQGSRYWTKEKIMPPADLEGGACYRVVYTLRPHDSTTNALATSTYDFRIFRREKVEAPWTFFESVADLKDKDRILVAKALASEEGLALERWVRAGGKALMFEIPENGWAPYDVEYRRGQTRVWRRTPGALPEIPEEALRSWAPDGYLGRSGVPKMGEDAKFLFDAGRKEGLSAAMIFRLFRGKGCYFCCQMPVLDRLNVEPAAPALLKALYAEFARDIVRPAGTVAIDNGLCPLTNQVVRTMFKEFGLPVANERGTVDQLLVLDCSEGVDKRLAEKVTAALADGRIVWMLEVPADVSPDILASYGLALTQPADTMTHVPWNPSSIVKVDNGVRWVTRVDEPGLLAGVSNDDLFWGNAYSVWGHFRGLDNGRLPMQFINQGEFRNKHSMIGATAILETVPGTKFTPKFRTEPAAWAEVKVGDGTLVVSTLRMAHNRATARTRIERTLRTALLNAGVSTAVDGSVKKFAPLDISKAMNRNLWHDPLTKQADGTYVPEAWFGTENDLRWFPVNLCGWSLEARNNCPKEEFPTKPMTMGAVPFLLTDPLKNGNKGCLILFTNEMAEIVFDSPVTCDHLEFLGAHSADWGMKTCDLHITFGDDRGEFVAQRGRHLGSCRWADVITEGRCAFSFPTLKDSMASLYRFTVPNPNPKMPVAKLVLKLDCNAGGVAVLAVTAETDVK